MRDKKRRLIHILITASAASVCAFFSIPCAVTAVIQSALFLILYELILAQRRDKAMKLCDDIDRILRSDDIISFDEYSEGELSVLSAEIHKMTTRLREQNAELKKEKKFAKEALEDISHQLRTPLTSVMMILGLINSPELTENERTEYIRDLYKLLARMKWLIETMLSLSRIEADAVKFTKERVNCRRLIGQSIDTVSVTAELKGVDIRTEITGDPEFVGDPHYTSEAIGNLLKNAVEHTAQGGTVTITSVSSNISTEIIISDTGEGIPESELLHIFERFFRSSEYNKNGFGIGLAFARKIITAQGGKLKASNIKPHGAAFTIRFYHTTI